MATALNNNYFQNMQNAQMQQYSNSAQAMTNQAAEQQTMNAAQNQVNTIQEQMNADNQKSQLDQWQIQQELQTSEFTTVQQETLAKQKAGHKAAQSIAQYVGS